MDSSNKVIILLLTIILLIILALGIKLVTNNKQDISGAIVEELNPKHKFYMEKIEETPNVVEEEEIKELPPQEEVIEEEPLTEKQFETFEVVRMNSESSQALIFYEINLEDIRCPIKEIGQIIFFDETKTYLGYGELKEFLRDSGIRQLLAFGGDNTEALGDIRRETGVSVMVKLGGGARERTNGVITEVEKPAYC
jgi:hypothetical protein